MDTLAQKRYLLQLPNTDKSDMSITTTGIYMVNIAHHVWLQSYAMSEMI